MDDVSKKAVMELAETLNECGYGLNLALELPEGTPFTEALDVAIKLRGQVKDLQRALGRWTSGTQIEGDYVDELELARTRIKELEQQNQDLEEAMTIASAIAAEEEQTVTIGCDHGVTFDYAEWKKNPTMGHFEVRTKWPRIVGRCPKGCGEHGIFYASYAHYIAGDW